jgi:hypothetical protein
MAQSVTKVFISSTCHDLLDLRSEVEQHISGMGLLPVLSDRPTSGFDRTPDSNSIDTCLVNVRSSDIFVCVLSQRYGPSLKTSGFDDISATHLEWREAISNKKPVYMYVRDKTMAECDLWKKTRRMSAGTSIDTETSAWPYSWVKEKRDEPLFKFLEEHMKLSSELTRKNWVAIFRDSVELKQMISSDLKLESSKALLGRAFQEGKMPILGLAAHSKNRQPQGWKLSINVVLKNNVPAINLQKKVDGFLEWNGDASLWKPGRLYPKKGISSMTFTLPNGSGDSPRKVFVRFVSPTGSLIEWEYDIEIDTSVDDWLTVKASRVRIIEQLNVEVV